MGCQRFRIGLLILILLTPIALIGSARAGQSGGYIDMDLFVASDGSVLFYGETNKNPPKLDPALGSLLFDKGHFSNTSDELTTKIGGNWTLRLNVTDDYSEAFIKIHLPSGAQLVGASPSGWGALPERRGLVINFYRSFNASDEIVISYRLNSVERPPLDYVPYALLIGIIAAGALLGRRYLGRGPKKPAGGGVSLRLDRAKMDAIAPTLTERERLVLETIVKEGGRVSQRKLRHLCELPKSTLSRITDELQRKGLLRKIPVGQTNELRLDERLLEGGGQWGEKGPK